MAGPAAERGAHGAIEIMGTMYGRQSQLGLGTPLAERLGRGLRLEDAPGARAKVALARMTVAATSLRPAAALRPSRAAARSSATSRRRVGVLALRRARAPRRHGLQGARGSAAAAAGLGRRGVLAVMRRRPNTCLERALVLQRWEADARRPRPTS